MFFTYSRLALLAAVPIIVTACQGVPADFKPDPKLQTATPNALKARIASACMSSQRARSSASTAQLQRPCNCYSGRIYSAMDASEVTFYRQNGYFADSARPKGEAALKACNLQV